ncbi:MAG TPA: CHAT domain-containing protein [Thermoanaerobaculia bacterium]|nr:CHAT domain-containing protein [Thermoanaerobaculia bacterium]
MRAYQVTGLALCTLLASGQPARPPVAPRPRPPLVSLLAQAGAHRESAMARDYSLDLAAGTFASLAVDQRGIDVVATVKGPDGRSLATSDGFFGAWGPEPVPVIAERSGRYRLEIRPLPFGTLEPAGTYQVRLDALRTATSRDRDLVAAERLFAAASYRQALAGFRALGERGREAETLYTLASLDPDLALAKEALALFRSLGRKNEEGQTLDLLGQIYQSQGNTPRALELYGEALELSRRLGERSAEAKTLMNRGRAYRTLGENGKAITDFRQAIDLWRAVGNRNKEAATRSILGNLYQFLGDPQQALNQLEPALALFVAAGNAQGEAQTLTSIGNSYSRMGQGQKGIAILQHALAIERRTGDRANEAQTLNDLGWVYILAHDWTHVRECFVEARALYRETRDRPAEVVALTNVAWADLEAGRSQEAVTGFNEALPLLAAFGDRTTEAFALLGLAQARRAAKDFTGSRAAVEQGIALIESLRGTSASREIRTSFLASKQELYSFAVDLLVEMHRAGEALAASERARARGLLDLLAESRTDLRRGVDPALLARVDEAGRKVNEADRRRWRLQSAGAAGKQQAEAERTLREALADSERAQTELRLASPAYAALAQSRPLSVPEIQRQVLDGETLLLEYHLGRERSFVWAVTPESVAAFPLPPRGLIEEAARRGYQRLERSRNGLARIPAEDSRAELSQLLLEPVAGLLGHKRLLIVPDGALFYLPFAALTVPGSSEPLVAGHEIVISPSASALALARRERAHRQPPSGALAVVADPVFDAAGSREGFQRLPYSNMEAAVLRDLVPPDQRLSALGFDASREAVLSGKLARYRIVHFATHGVLDTEHPELSKLLFSQVDEHGRPRAEDGFVWAHEIYGLHLPADLVVLSACQTALGQEIHGEGLVGLTRGFQYAGARAVLVSLWEVDDEATAELMRLFYRELLQHGQSPAAALRNAQDALRRRPEWNAPYYWAGFVLQGDWRPPVNPSAPAGPATAGLEPRGSTRRMR